MKYLIIAQGFLFLFFLTQLARVEMVGFYRGQLIDSLFKRPDWAEAQKYFNSVSFGTMVWKFWKPIRSFYDESKLR